MRKIKFLDTWTPAPETGAAAGSLTAKHGITGHVWCFRFDSAVIGAAGWSGRCHVIFQLHKVLSYTHSWIKGIQTDLLPNSQETADMSMSKRSCVENAHLALSWKTCLVRHSSSHCSTLVRAGKVMKTWTYVAESSNENCGVNKIWRNFCWPNFCHNTMQYHLATYCTGQSNTCKCTLLVGYFGGIFCQPFAKGRSDCWSDTYNCHIRCVNVQYASMFLRLGA